MSCIMNPATKQTRYAHFACPSVHILIYVIAKHKQLNHDESIHGLSSFTILVAKGRIS